jgi:hypothetical protein
MECQRFCLSFFCLFVHEGFEGPLEGQAHQVQVV